MNRMERQGPDDEIRVVRLGDGFVPCPDGALLRVGETVDPGSREALLLADRLVQGKRILGRFSHSPATIGVACDRLEAPALLVVSFIMDATAEAWWRERVAGLGTRGRARVTDDPVAPPLGGDAAVPGSYLESRRSRLVEVKEASGTVGYALATAPATRGTRLSYGFASIPVMHADAEPGILAFSITDVEPVPGVRRVLPARWSVVGLILEEVALVQLGGDEVAQVSGVIDPGRAEILGLLTTGAAGHRAGPGARRLFEGSLILRRQGNSYPEVRLTCGRGERDLLGEDEADNLAQWVHVDVLGGGGGEPTAVMSADGQTFRLRVDDTEVDAEGGDHVFVTLPDADPSGWPLVWHVTSLIS